MATKDLKVLHVRRGTLKAQLTFFEKYLNRIRESPLTQIIITQLQTRLDKIESLWGTFDSLQNEIDEIAVDIEAEYAERESFQDVYFNLVSEGQQLIMLFNTSNNETLPHVQSYQGSHHDVLVASGSEYQAKSNIKLPTISLPTFDGSFIQWREFFDTFKAIIHSNSALSDVQKLCYLRASLTGEAANVVKSFETTDDNYIIVWNLLQDRYNNKRRITLNHTRALLELPAIPKESHIAYRTLIDTVQRHCRCLESLDQPIDNWDAILVPLVSSKLDLIANRDWESRVNSEPNSRDIIPTLTELISFLTFKHDTLEAINANKQPIEPKLQNVRTNEQKSNTKRAFVSSTPVCAMCNGAHYINNCKDFLKLAPESRLEYVKKLSLCINCLNKGHLVATCKFRNCKVCNTKHHTLLHFEKVTVDRPVTSERTATLSTHINLNSTQVLLATAFIKVFDANGNVHLGRALLDCASQSNFITTEFCNALKLKTVRTDMTVMGINQITSNSTKRCNLKIQSRFNNNRISLSCLVIPQISDQIPTNSIDVSNFNIPSYLNLADPQFGVPGQIDILLGADIFWTLLCAGQFNLGHKQPKLQDTSLGWIVVGEVGKQSKGARSSMQTQCNLTQNRDVQDQLAKFWEIEQFESHKFLSDEERACESHFNNTVKRNLDGRFTVSIPYKDSLNKLGKSLCAAQKRFYSLERKLQCKPTLKKLYSEFMEEYLDLGHMSPVGHESQPQYSNYMPHHGVFKETSQTTKLRVVFDGSHPTSTGVSVNDLQMVGPTIQRDLFLTLLRFRQYPIVISADITKMYRQVLVDPNQRSLQRILWRSDPNMAVQEYELNTITYGTASASFLAIRCLKELADRYRSQFPVACNIIERDFYVDDLLSGADSDEQATIICKQVSHVLRLGCFELRKWKSNHPLIYKDFQNTEQVSGILDFGSNENSKTLGLTWSCKTDHLSYSIDTGRNKNDITKRTILSIVSQIFDPLGLVSPCIIVAKILLQSLWAEKISWDDPVSNELSTRWLKFKEELQGLNKLEIPRNSICKDYLQTLELHCFSDASELAYGACVYIRSTDSQNKYCTRLLCAKSKVAPLKTLTIPRLELCAALLAVKLADKIVSSSSLHFFQYFWTDSTVVLGWISKSPSELKTFVANRVAEIQEKGSSDLWRHVKSGDNPADLVSRGISPGLLKDASIWWHGPKWLADNETHWPAFQTADPEELPELKSKSFVNTIEFDIFSKFSTLTRLQRVIAYCFRFRDNCKTKQKNYEPLSTQELSNSLTCLIKIAQGQLFKEEINALGKNKPLKSTSNMMSLNPFLDRAGLLRVGGRLVSSEFDFNKRHPIILPSKHALSYMIAYHEHRRLMHCGSQALLYSLREKYWPICGRNLTKKIIHECVVCFRCNPRPDQFMMGNLPKNRVTPTFPFYNTGVDYAGPFIVRDKRSRGYKTTKAYVCLFVCLAVKAIHLELVGDLTTEGFLAAFRRFTSRRGKPCNIYSDNGSNFIGARNELQALGTFLSERKNNISDSCVHDNITWHFIPARSPHFGGLWEAGVKSMKFHLKRVVGNALLTFEDFSTVLAQIESILNSRPISPISSDPNDLTPLTPAHFLIGRALTSLPDPDLHHLSENRLGRFQYLQKLQQSFWSRWSKEYISQLQQRIKWQQNQGNIAVGTLVLIQEDNLPSLCWQIGRIHELHPGSDDVVRVVTIRTIKGFLKRAVNKLCPLPIDNSIVANNE